MAGRVKVRALSFSHHPPCMSSIWSKAIGCRVFLIGHYSLCVNGKTSNTHAYTINPQGGVIFPPLKSNMDLLGRGGQLAEIINDCISFCFRNTNYVRDKTYTNFEVSVPGSKQQYGQNNCLEGCWESFSAEARLGTQIQFNNRHFLPKILTRAGENKFPPNNGVSSNQ